MGAEDPTIIHHHAARSLFKAAIDLPYMFDTSKNATNAQSFTSHLSVQIQSYKAVAPSNNESSCTQLNK